MKMSGPYIASIALLAGCASTPDFDPEVELTKAVNAESKAFSTCYRKHGEAKNFDTTLNFRLNFASEIQFAEIDQKKSADTPPAMGECILGHFKKLKLPVIEGYHGAVGSFSFQFVK